jgi:segregation and condensation protein B
MLKNSLEALLFSSGRKMDIEELSKLSRTKPDEVQCALAELKKEYDEKNASIMLINEGNSWKLTVREQFLNLVRKIVSETELSKTIMETLAVIAFRYPIKQSELIKIRTNKAYDHLKELEEMGYITRQKHGRTNLIKLTQKFFDYFDLKEEQLKDQFRDFESIANAIEEKEKHIEKIRQDQKERAMQEKQQNEEMKGEG